MQEWRAVTTSATERVLLCGFMRRLARHWQPACRRRVCWWQWCGACQVPSVRSGSSMQASAVRRLVSHAPAESAREASTALDIDRKKAAIFSASSSQLAAQLRWVASFKCRARAPLRLAGPGPAGGSSGAAVSSSMLADSVMGANAGKGGWPPGALLLQAAAATVAVEEGPSARRWWLRGAGRPFYRSRHSRKAGDGPGSGKARSGSRGRTPTAWLPLCRDDRATKVNVNAVCNVTHLAHAQMQMPKALTAGGRPPPPPPPPPHPTPPPIG